MGDEEEWRSSSEGGAACPAASGIGKPRFVTALHAPDLYMVDMHACRPRNFLPPQDDMYTIQRVDFVLKNGCVWRGIILHMSHTNQRIYRRVRTYPCALILAVGSVHSRTDKNSCVRYWSPLCPNFTFFLKKIHFGSRFFIKTDLLEPRRFMYRSQSPVELVLLASPF